MTELTVNSDELPGNAARALFRFNLPHRVAGCTLESATLRLYHESSTEGRTLEAVADRRAVERADAHVGQPARRRPGRPRPPSPAGRRLPALGRHRAGGRRPARLPHPRRPRGRPRGRRRPVVRQPGDGAGPAAADAAAAGAALRAGHRRRRCRPTPPAAPVDTVVTLRPGADPEHAGDERPHRLPR